MGSATHASEFRPSGRARAKVFTVRGSKSLKISTNTEWYSVVDSTFHLRDERFVMVQLEDLLNTLRADRVPVHVSQISLVVPESSRQTMWLELDIKVLCLDVRKRPIYHTPTCVSDCDLSVHISIAAKSTLRIEHRRGLEMLPVLSPVPIDQLSSEITLLAQGCLVDMEEIAVPGQEGSGIVCIEADMAVDPGEVFIGCPVRLDRGGNCCQTSDGGDVMFFFGLRESAPFATQCTSGCGVGF